MAGVNSKTSMAGLMMAHIAGMVDMMALPLWVGGLIQFYGSTPQQAGLMVTVFLLSVSITSLLFSSQFNRVPRRLACAAGYAVAAAAFYFVGVQDPGAASLQTMGVLHLLAGVGIGCALSLAQGAMGRAANPHRMFAAASTLLGLFGVVFLGLMPVIINRFGPPSVFFAFTVLMGAAALAMLVAYPTLDEAASGAASRATEQAPIPRAAWFAILTVVCLTLNYAMVFSFVERVGAERGFTPQQIGAALLAIGIVNVFPSPLAGILERRIAPTTMALCALLAQGLLALVIFNAHQFELYATAAALCVVPVLLGHIFLFGLISRLDTSGRSSASTPAMIMIGSSIGPAVGGALVQQIGYPAVAVASVVVALGGMTFATLTRRSAPGLA